MKKIYYLLTAAIFAPGLMFAQPANDNCSGAIPIEVDGESVIADNTEATIYGPHGTCFFDINQGQITGDVWFSITLTEPKALLINTVAGTSGDSQLALFTIEDCGGPDEEFTEIACNDDISFFEVMSQILTEELAAGTYYLRASTYGEFNAGDYSISVITAVIPENDSCEGAIELEIDGEPGLADNLTATIVGPEGTCIGTAQTVGDTWFSFTLTEQQNVRVFTEAGTSTDSQVSVYTIEGCGTGSEVYTEVGCNEDMNVQNGDFMSLINMYDLPAGTYYVKAGTYGSFSTGTYLVYIQSLEDAPLGSSCDEAEAVELEVNGPTAVVTGSGAGAIDYDGFGAPHVWEAFTITECADVTIDFCDVSIPLEQAYITLFDECPVSLDAQILSFGYDFTTCVNENLTINFIQLPAGTYYYPLQIPVGSVFEESYTINFTATTCTAEPDTCLYYTNGPWTDFNNMFGGAPVPDSEGNCTANTIDVFEVYASESYTIDGFIENVEYTFSICEGGDAGAWSPAISVTDPNGVVVAYEENCTITWIAEMAGTYIIGISEVGSCYISDNTATSNGFPSLTCQGTIGLEKIENNVNFSVYPNPNNGSFSIANVGIAGNYNIELIDLTGRTVYAQTSEIAANAETYISTNGIAPGVYTLRMINSKENTFSTQRIVVR